MSRFVLALRCLASDMQVSIQCKVHSRMLILHYCRQVLFLLPVAADGKFNAGGEAEAAPGGEAEAGEDAAEGAEGVLLPPVHHVRCALTCPSQTTSFKMCLTAADGHGRRTVTLLQFAAYFLSVRAVGTQALFRFGRLFQEWICSFYAMIERQRLRWIKNNQKTIRADLYSGVRVRS